MKALIVLILVQIGVLILMFGKLVAIEEEMAPAMLDQQDTLVSDDLTNMLSQSNSSNLHIYPDEDRLRQIIREELRAELGGSSGPDKQEDPAIASVSTNEAEIEYQRELVAQRLEYHTSVGSISNVDMQKLQGEIAKLDEAGRKEMLGKLTRALNSGRFDGRL